MRQSLRATPDSSKFTAKTLEATNELIKSGRLPLKRTTIGDDVEVGLRAMFTQSGDITFHVVYDVGDSRPVLKIGVHDPAGKHPEHISIKKARERARAIKALGEKGIDVQDGLHKRLLREIDRDGANWKGDEEPPARKRA